MVHSVATSPLNMTSTSVNEPADRLRQAREEAGYDKAAKAAQAMGIPEPTYQAHENGNRGFLTAADRYADFFRVNLEWLLKGRGQMRRGDPPAPIAEQPSRNSPVLGQEPLTEGTINTQMFPRDVPILGSGSCGEDGLFELNGQIHGYAKRTPRLMNVKGAYAVYIHGLSMWPWRKPGQLAFVDPYQPPNIGDFVVVQLKAVSEGQHIAAYIKQLARRTARELRLHQFNPEEDLTIPAAKVLSVHRVIDWDELLGL